MQNIIAWLNTEYAHMFFTHFFRILGVFIIGRMMIYSSAVLIKRLAVSHLTSHMALLLEKMMKYIIVFFVGCIIAQELGFNVVALLGAAGVIGVAVGFASQTSISNIISGLFLLSEQSFDIGDIVQMNDIEGYVVSIDLLSIKVRTYTNGFVRLPNEQLVKASFINLTRFPTRRYDLFFNLDYTYDCAKIFQVLEKAVQSNAYALKDIKPYLIVKSFGDYGMKIQLGVWVNTADWNHLKVTLPQEIKMHLEKANINLLMPHVQLLCQQHEEQKNSGVSST